MNASEGMWNGMQQPLMFNAISLSCYARCVFGCYSISCMLLFSYQIVVALCNFCWLFPSFCQLAQSSLALMLVI